MKRIFAVLLAILLCVPACFPVFADIGGPEFTNYKVTLKADTPYYASEYDRTSSRSYFVQIGTIPAGTELTITGEYETDGELYGYFSNTNAAGISFTGYLRVRDLQTEPIEPFPATSGYKQSIPVRLRVGDPNGAVMYAGPSLLYAQICVIPQGTELTVDILDQPGYSIAQWMYVMYDGKAGWTKCWLELGVDYPMQELLPEGKTGTLWVVRDGAVLKDKDWNEVIAVPKGTKLTFDSFNRMPKSRAYYVTYQGKSGILWESYESADNYIACKLRDADTITAVVKKDFSETLYAVPDRTHPISTVSYHSGDTLQYTYPFYGCQEDDISLEYWYCTSVNGKTGWVMAPWDTLDFSNAESDESYIADVFKSESSTPTEVPVPPTTTEAQSSAGETKTTGKDGSGSALSAKDFIIVCVVAAVILMLTAVVTLVLINRKKQR